MLPQIAGFIHPNNQRVPVCDQDPLSDVKLGVVDQQRSLNILLDHVSGLLCSRSMLHYSKNSLKSEKTSIKFIFISWSRTLSPVTDGDSSSSAGASWLYNPKIKETIHF